MISKNSQRAAVWRLNSRVGFADYVKTSAIAVATAAPLPALADFSLDYALTPPANGTFADANTNGTFGKWTGTLTSSSDVSNGFSGPGHANLSTLLAPNELFLEANTGLINDEATNPVDYTFLVTAAASGLVSFDYVRTSFITNAISDLQFEDLTTHQAFSLTNGANAFSTSVSAGDIFGFHLFFSYPSNGSLTITNFSAPEPTTSVPDQGSTIALLTFGFIGLLAYRATAARRGSVGV